MTRLDLSCRVNLGDDSDTRGPTPSKASLEAAYMELEGEPSKSAMLLTFAAESSVVQHGKVWMN